MSGTSIIVAVAVLFLVLPILLWAGVNLWVFGRAVLSGDMKRERMDRAHLTATIAS